MTGTYTGGVPETGQTLQYDANTSQADDGGTDPPGRALPNPRFFDNSNGSVTDNLTGLIWLKNANCAGVPRNWQLALDDVVQLNTDGKMNSNACGYTGGETDWRLPTIKELQSLVYFGYVGPALSDATGMSMWTEGDPFNAVQSYYYWSGTTRSVDPDYAWSVDMHYGAVDTFDKASNPFNVWPVRGGL